MSTQTTLRAALPVLPKVTAVSPYVSTDPAMHLLRRAAYGPTPASIAAVRRYGYAGWIDRQLRPSTIADTRCDSFFRARLAKDDLWPQNEAIWHVKDLLESERRDGWRQTVGVSIHHTVRALWSERQLLTVLEDFWGNHFNVTTPGSETVESRAHYAHTIRTYSLGKFSDLLRAVTMHPAMLTYLNNRDSEDTHPNENHGRELLELHTVGVHAGYTETDVLNAARVLTGLSVSEDSGEFMFKPWYHWVGRVRVMGWSHTNTTEAGGLAVARQLIDYLAMHPTTARRICRLLAVRFVSDNPSNTLVTALTKTYIANKSAIAPVVRQILLSREFAASAGAKIWRPYEQLIATSRRMGLAPYTGTDKDKDPIDGPEQLWYMAAAAGHPLFGAPFPTGHEDVSDAWLSTSTTLRRWNNLRSFQWDYPGAFNRPVMRDLLIGTTRPATHAALLDTLATSLFGRTLTTAHRSAVLTFLGHGAADRLAADSAAWTWRFGDIVSVLLDSPYQLAR